MYEITILTEALKFLDKIREDVLDDLEILRDFAVVGRILKTIPLEVGRQRLSSVHRLVTRRRVMAEYEVIEDDKRVIIHSFGLLPAP